MSDPEYSLLQSISDNGGAVLVREVPADSVPVMRLLVDRGYVVRVGALNLARYEITDSGRVALSDFEVARRRRRSDNIRYIITTAVAVLALLVAIASFLQSSGRLDLLQWPPRLLPPAPTSDASAPPPGRP